MKTQKYFKQVMMTAAVVLVAGNLSSCKDQDFDWDAAHANDAQKKFTNVFIEAFGEPETGHQWGFDMPWEETRSSIPFTRASEPTVYKPEYENMDRIAKLYGTVPNILKQEHFEVREWFAKHKVNWEHTTRVVGNVKNGDMLYEINSDNTTGNALFTATITEGNVTSLTNKNESILDAAGYGISTKKIRFKKSGSSEYLDGYFTIDNTNSNSPAYAIVEVVNFELYGYQSTRNNVSATCTADLNEGNSIRKHMSKQNWKNGQVVAVGTTIDFTHAWLQHVSYDADYPKGSGQYEDNDMKSVKDESWIYKTSDTDPTWWYNYRTVSDEKDANGTSMKENPGSKMNYLHTMSSSTDDHNLDFNAYVSSGNSAWGYNRQSETIVSNGVTYNKNGQLIMGANFNNLVYGVSTGSNLYHDKWIIVYLEGDGYAGYYLGFDFEGYGNGNQADAQVEANGVCDDWIFKISAVNPYVEEYPTNCRIMCEDLGGFNNVVTFDKESHISDIDYNDVVIDVTSDDNKVVNITLQAAGGTLPLSVWYDGKPLFETHEFFDQYVVRSDYEKHSNCTITTYDADTPSNFGTGNYKIMYNTEGGSKATTTDNKPSQTVALLCNTSKHCKDANLKAVRFDSDFDLSKLDIRVWRNTAQSYIDLTSYGSFTDSPAEWLTITNYDGEAPLKICVPTTVQWLKERVAVDQGYPSFKTWVGDHSNYFWIDEKNNHHPTVNTGNLCTNRTASKPKVCSTHDDTGGGSTGGGSTSGSGDTGNNEGNNTGNQSGSEVTSIHFRVNSGSTDETSYTLDAPADDYNNTSLSVSIVDQNGNTISNPEFSVNNSYLNVSSWSNSAFDWNNPCSSEVTFSISADTNENRLPANSVITDGDYHGLGITPSAIKSYTASSDQQCVITATYGGCTATLTVTVKGQSKENEEANDLYNMTTTWSYAGLSNIQADDNSWSASVQSQPENSYGVISVTATYSGQSKYMSWYVDRTTACNVGTSALNNPKAEWPLSAINEDLNKAIGDGKTLNWNTGTAFSFTGSGNWSGLKESLTNLKLLVNYEINSADDHMIRFAVGNSWSALPGTRANSTTDSDGNIHVSSNGCVWIEVTEATLDALTNNGGLLMCGYGVTIKSMYMYTAQ